MPFYFIYSDVINMIPIIPRQTLYEHSLISLTQITYMFYEFLYKIKSLFLIIYPIKRDFYFLNYLICT